MTALKAGQLLELDRAASPQFAARTVRLRVVRELTDRPTYHGWLWLAGYELDARGDAIRLRELYVRRAGIRQLSTSHSHALTTSRQQGVRSRP